MSETYSRGDLRACGNHLCDHYVVFIGPEWRHIPIWNDKGYLDWSTMCCDDPHPYPEHKHAFRYLSSMNRGVQYHFVCTTCTMHFSYGKRFVKNLLMGGKK